MENPLEGVRIDARMARLIYFFNTKQDDFYPMRRWPGHMQRRALQLNKGNRDRWMLFFFLHANGLAAATAAEWATLNDVRNGRLILDNRRRTGEHRRQLMREAHSGWLFRGKTRVHDMHLNKVITL